MREQMKQEFLSPSNRFRPIPFWSWNDRLEDEELEEQIRELKQSGAGGYFMHARSGLQTEYLSEDWFARIKTGIDMAREQGMDAWIYDEEGWPSGFAGGIVPQQSRDFWAKYMTLEHHSETDPIETEDLIALYVYCPDTGCYQRLSIPDGQGKNLAGADSVTSACRDCGSNGEYLAVRRHSNRFYVDTLNKDAIDAFLACTHEAYFERFGEEFGTCMKGFFTDEPRLVCNNFGDLAWSDRLPEAFLKEYSYDILDCLPALFLPVPGCEKYRYDFWSLVSKLFTENYMKNIYDWCEAHGCKSTGHIMMEESVFSQMTSTAGVMPFYEYLHVPGIDWLRRMIDSPVIGKQVGSVACQLGKKQVLTESFALCGWNVSFEELKWIAQWQFVNGVNQICQHLMAYTIRGSRKRDYPPSHFIQQTWWKDSRLFQDYLARLCVALSEGDQMADVLLIHPMKSGYVSYDGTRTDSIRRLDSELTKIANALSGAHISYHFGDETIIKKYGCVKDGSFMVGRIPYGAVILPHMYAIEGRTVELLLAFASQGGVIISTGELPSYTNGGRNDLERLKDLAVKMDGEAVRGFLEGKRLVTLSIAKHGREISQISYQQRSCEDGTILYLVNLDQKQGFDADIRILDKRCKVWELEAENGEQNPVAYEAEGQHTEFSLHFEPMGSYMLLLEPTNDKFCRMEEPVYQVVRPGEDWDVKAMDLNSLTLDTCCYSIDNGQWSGPVSVIRLQEMLLELQRPCAVDLKFQFTIDMDPEQSSEFYAVIEDAEKYRVTVNGQEVSTEYSGWWKDKSFHKVNIRPYIVKGLNTLAMHVDFHQPQRVYDVLFGEHVYETEKNKITYEVELESIYLLGEFGVYSESPFRQADRDAMVTEGPFVIKNRPEQFTGSEFTAQGLLCFAGTVKLSQKLVVHRQEGKRVLLDYGKQNAPLAKLYVNGRLVKESLWAPYTADITDYVSEGENELCFELFASNRNLLGPHHHIDGECYNVGPESFTGRWSWVERKSEADATDIEDKFKNYWTDTYCFVRFGFEGGAQP